MDTKKNNLYVISLLFAGLVLVYFYQYLNPSAICNATDVLTQQIFWEKFLKNQLHNSPSFATWLPYVNGGTPFGGGLEKLFKPLSFFLYYFAPPNLALSFDAIIHFWLMAFGTFLFGRVLGFSISSACLSAIFFTFATEQVSLMNAGHIGKLSAIAWTPLIFWAVERGIKSKKIIDFIFAGIFLSLQFYEGHIQISFYVCITVGIYFIGRTASQLIKKEVNGNVFGKQYARGVLMVVVFLLLSSFTVAHWLEFKEQSDRSEGTPYEFATSWSMPPEELATFIVPKLFGLSRANAYHPEKIDVYYWGRMPFTQTNDYLGLLPIFLALIALFKIRNNYLNIFAFLSLSFLVLAMGRYTPIYYFFYKYAGFKFFRVPKMNLFIVSFAVAMMAGFGMDWLLATKKKADNLFMKRLLWCLGGFAAILLILYVAGILNSKYWIDTFQSHLAGGGRSYSRSASVISQRFQGANENILMTAILLTILFVGVVLYWKNKITGKVLFYGMTIFFLFDISLVNRHFLDTITLEGSVYVERNSAIKYFQDNPGRYRVLNGVREVPTYSVPNKFLMFKIESATGYEAVSMARYGNLLKQLSLGANVVDLMNVKYVILDKKAIKGEVGSRMGKYEIVMDSDVKILKNNNVLPRAFAVHRAALIKDPKSMLATVNNPKFNPGKIVLLEEDVKVSLPKTGVENLVSKVDITKYENEEISISANMADNGFVVLGEKYYPGWKAYVDGVETAIYQADYAFRALYAPKGEHKIIVRYEPASYKTGLYLSLISVLCVFGVLAYHGVRFYREDRVPVTVKKNSSPKGGKKRKK